MPHQGNIYLGYNLVLLVQPLVAGRDHRVQLAQKTTARAIRAHAKLHLRSRFYKEERQNRQDGLRLLEKVVRNRLCIVSLSSKGIPPLFKTKRNTQPRVYVLVDTRSATRFDDVRDQVRTQNPQAHVEHFHIRCPSEDSISKLEKRLRRIHPVSLASLQAEGIYHLSSRICDAFVEYCPPWPGVPMLSGGLCRSNKSESDEFWPPTFAPIPLDHFATGVRVDASVTDIGRKIMDISDAVDLVCGCLDGHMRYFPPVPEQLRNIFEGVDTGARVWTRYKFPFGVWFRGSSRICLDLQPSIFRYTEPRKIHRGCTKRSHEQVVMFDECSMVHHFREHLPDLRTKYGTMFDWLCLMQHHGTPSRLLDWTENILYALYFAVRDRNVDCDGVVWVLNAGRLNEITRVSTTHRYVCFPSSADVHLRTVMAMSHNWPELRRNLLKLGLLEVVLDSMTEPDRKRVTSLMSGDKELSFQRGRGCPIGS